MNERFQHDFRKDIMPTSDKERELRKKIDNKMEGVRPDEYDSFVLSRKRDVMADVSSKKLEGLINKEKKYNGLELGVGTGIYTQALNRIQNLNLKGIEIREDLINFGLSKSRFTEEQVVLGDFHRLPFPDESFDLVTGLAITRQREDVKKFYSEIKRVLRSGGIFFIPFIEPRSETINRESRLMNSEGLNVIEDGRWYIVAKK